MSSIFLSHSHKDKPFARILSEKLQSHGIRTWIDEGEMQVGDSLITKIEMAIQEFEYLGVILSPDSVSSEWVQREVQIALVEEIQGKKAKVLPILYKKCDIPKFLITKVYADLSENFEEGFEKVLYRLRSDLYTETHKQKRTYEILQTAYQDWISFGTKDYQLLSRDTIELALPNLVHYKLSLPLVKYLLCSISFLSAREELEINNLHALLKKMDPSDVLDLFYYLLKHPNSHVRIGFAKLALQFAELKVLDVLTECLQVESNYRVKKVYMQSIYHLEKHLPEDVGSDSLPQPRKQSENMGAGVSARKKFNHRLILNYLRERGPGSQVTIAEDLGLPPTTVSGLIDELKREELVYEGEKLEARADRGPGGRRATSIHFNANAGYVIGVDVGRAHLTIHLTNLAAETIKKWYGPFDMDRFGAEQGLEFVAGKLHDLVGSSHVTWNQVRGIGLASPGLPDPNFRTLVGPPLLRGWLGIDIPKLLRRKLRLKQDIPIYLGEDGNAGAFGESRYGEGHGIANMVYIKIGTGIGSGLILNGKLYVGSRGVAGEVGHVLIENGGPRCSACGKVGCLEALAGGSAIVEDARTGMSLMEGVDRTHLLPPSSALVNSTGELGIADVLRGAKEGDAACRAALERAGKRVGKVIGSYMLNVYNPSMVLLDGGVVRVKERGAVRVNEVFLAALRESVKASTLPIAWEGTEIQVAKLGDNAIALGAAAIAIDNDKEFGGGSILYD